MKIETIYKNHSLQILYFAALILYIAEWWIFRSHIFVDSPSIGGTMLKSAADGMMFFILFWVLPMRLKWIGVVVPFWLISLFMLINACYYRFFECLTPISSLFYFDNFDSLVFRAGASVLQWYDCFYIIFPIIVTVLFFCYKKFYKSHQQHISKKQNLAMVVASLLVFSLAQFNYANTLKNTYITNGIQQTLLNVFKEKYTKYNHNYNDLRINGLYVYTIKQTISDFYYSKKVIELSEEQNKKIDDYLELINKNIPSPDSAFAANRNKNLILIIVESLNAEVVGRHVNSLPITPVLDSLMKLNGTICSLNMISQVADGGSADGQMIYNTGLLPIDKGAAAMLYDSNKYPSLAKFIGYEDAVEVIAEKPLYWNHSTTNKLYGYTKLISKEDIENKGIDIDAVGRDRAVFNMAENVIQELKQPFFIEITTLSMHSPFDEEAAPRYKQIDEADISNLEKNYLTSTKYFDYCLGEFISWLKQNGYYENTVIAIASDHSCSTDPHSAEKMNGKTVFMALNTGVTKNIKFTTGQVNVFPTLIHIMDKYNPASAYNGLAPSMLNENMFHESVDSYNIPQISNLIIRSNYFSKKHVNNM